MFNFFLRRNRWQSRNLIYNVIPDGKIKEMISSPNNILIDVRNKREYNTMHIVNSINIPVEALRKTENEYRNKEAIIVYCSTGARTKDAIKILNMLGYTNVYIWRYGALSSFPFKEMIKM